MRDDVTPRGFALPHPENRLEQDVFRLRTAINAIDEEFNKNVPYRIEADAPRIIELRVSSQDNGLLYSSFSDSAVRVKVFDTDGREIEASVEPGAPENAFGDMNNLTFSGYDRTAGKIFFTELTANTDGLGSIKTGCVKVPFSVNFSISGISYSAEREVYINFAYGKGAIEFRISEGYVQWRHVNDSAWINIIALSDITGPQGQDGQAGAVYPSDTSEINPAIGKTAVVSGVGLFVYHEDSEEPVDGETCIASAGGVGRWLLEIPGYELTQYAIEERMAGNGSGIRLKNVIVNKQTVSFGNIAASSSVEVNVPMLEARPYDTVALSTGSLPSGLSLFGFIAEKRYVKIRLLNVTAAAMANVSAIVKIMLFKED
jgi:hypothetical protein